jgi:DNA-3-methyladenine glycosylase
LIGLDLSELLSGPPEQAAPRLLGSHFVSEIDHKLVRIRITEVEAYKGTDDPASHAFNGRSPRNGSMFEKPGTLYVYRSYGIHNCANTAAGPVGTGWGILIRGGDILEGEGIVRSRRRRRDQLTNGPGKLTESLGITMEHNGTDLLDPESQIRIEPGETPQMVLSTPRVGLSKAKERPWRFITATSADVP